MGPERGDEGDWSSMKTGQGTKCLLILVDESVTNF